MKKLFFCVAITCIATISCTYNKKEQVVLPLEDICITKPASFMADVQPLIESNCAIPGCHASGSGAGGVVLETFSQISGKAARIKQRALVEKSMPPSGPLSAAEIQALECWINNGAPNN